MTVKLKKTGKAEAAGCRKVSSATKSRCRTGTALTQKSYIWPMQGKGKLSGLKQWLSSFLSIFLALLIFNSSTDSPDTRYTMVLQDGSYKEDLSKNDIETLYEFVAELLLDHTDAVGENDDQENNSLLKKLDSALLQNYSLVLCSYETELEGLTLPSGNIRIPKISLDIPYPPPEKLLF
ncbi:hypothetical protein [Pedobacter sp. SYSU D00535]|uniref:hypothetical protein n=1 Tax=Pedobacter sp. SYSU D00535 TaxID=2810308 RepID=UPI001A973F95|nr:hypothetical protein [Pedobacter sp. SYSU D00535]